MNIDRTRGLSAVAGLTVGCLLLAAAGCARTQPVEAAPTGFGPVDATAVLSAFDVADSAATTTGDEDLLRRQEAEPSLSFSLAAVRSARKNGRRQPTFQHRNPAFAIKPDGSCFLAVAALRLAGEELERHDVSVFVHDGNGGWRLSHHVLLGQETPADAVAITATGLDGAQAVAAPQRKRLAAEVYARSTGTSTPQDTIAQTPLLDKRLAGGWAIYQQQLAANGFSVTRTLDDSTVSPCAARVGAQTLVFLTLKVTDTIKAKKGQAPATVTTDSPDGVALGLRKDVQGRSVSVRRTEVFLVSVGPDGTGPDAVLGLNDAPTAATATG